MMIVWMPLAMSPRTLTVPSVVKLTPPVTTLSNRPNCLAWRAKVIASRPASATHMPWAPESRTFWMCAA